MSHIPQRKEKDCLNCGTIVQGRYCHVCGQENVVPKETFWHMVTHFFYDVTHFDSNFFHTVHHLLLKPGFLSKEYIAGRRTRYLHPIRMYVFTSAVFFLLFFSFFSPEENVKTNFNNPLSRTERLAYVQRLQAKVKQKPGDSLLMKELVRARDTSQVITIGEQIDQETGFQIISFTDRDYKTRAEYDSIQRLLPRSEKDGWLKRRLVRKQIEINTRYHNPDEALKKFVESLLHRLPYMLFVSLPLFALILKMVYFRRRHFYYADHGVFTIHLYVFTFILLLTVFVFDKFDNLTGWGFWSVLKTLLVVLLFFYLYKALRNFYGQRRAKTFLKFILVALSSLTMMLILFVLFMFFSAVTF